MSQETTVGVVVAPGKGSVRGSRKGGRKGRSAGFPSPDQIRLSIQALVADEQIDEAVSLSEQGMSAYPENEGVLAITSLLAVVRQDWDRAVGLLERLMAIQGEAATEFTRDMYARALQCSGKALPDERQDDAVSAG